jgi:hypothetical protein
MYEARIWSARRRILASLRVGRRQKKRKLPVVSVQAAEETLFCVWDKRKTLVNILKNIISIDVRQCSVVQMSFYQTARRHIPEDH